MVASRSLLWMTDRRAADNKIKIGERARMGITGELSTSMQRQRKGKINEAYKNRMATWLQWVIRKSRGVCCGVTDRNIILVLSRFSIIPKFDLFRLCRSKNLSTRTFKQRSLPMKHRVQSVGGLWELPNFCCLSLVAVWLTFAIPLEPAAVLRAQLLVQLLQDQFQLVDLSGAGQGDLLHRNVNASQPGCTNQGARIFTTGLSRDVFGLTTLIWTLRWILFQCDSCLGRNLHDDDWSICTHTVWVNLRNLSKSPHGCMKLRLSIRTCLRQNTREPGDSRLDWLTLLNSHSRWWSTSPS